MIRHEFEENRKYLCENLHSLIVHFDKNSGPERLLETQVMLETIPLSTSEFDLATRRVVNARRYVQSGELGAAKYEMRMLLGMLDEECAFIKRRQIAKPVTRKREPPLDDSLSWSHASG